MNACAQAFAQFHVQMLLELGHDFTRDAILARVFGFFLGEECVVLMWWPTRVRDANPFLPRT